MAINERNINNKSSDETSKKVSQNKSTITNKSFDGRVIITSKESKNFNR